ncbi:MAG: hypothetical protein IKR42_02290 [Campylobacter sp.]|nr:hypothetical protein [Campylobacter sp.]
MLGGNIIGKTDTISLAIYNAVYDGENEKALVFSLILVVLGIFMFYFTNKLTKKIKQIYFLIGQKNVLKNR